MRRFLLVALSLLLSAAALAQQQQPQLTWVRFYQGGDVTPAAKAKLDPLLASKKIAGWGVLEPMSHLGEEWSQALFVTVQDWSVLDDIDLPDGARVHDVVLRHVIQSQGPGAKVPRFLVTNYHPITRGRDTDAHALFNEWAKPVFDKLTAAGKIGPWGLSVQTIVIDNKWTYMVWYFMPDLSALDDVHTELMAMGMSRLMTYERRLREMSEDDYIGQVLRVVHWGT